MADLVITVHGTPAPQGSKRHVGNGVMVESSRAVKPWREAVKAAALAAGTPPMLRGPVEILACFYLARPKGHFGTGRNAGKVKLSAPTYPAVKPDLDKVVRATLDALKDAGVYADDAQAVSIETAKRYAASSQPPGAYIRVVPIDDEVIDEPGEAA